MAPSEADSQYFFAANLNLGPSNEQSFAAAVEPLARALVRVHGLCLPVGTVPGSARGAFDQLNRPHNLSRFAAWTGIAHDCLARKEGAHVAYQVGSRFGGVGSSPWGLLPITSDGRAPWPAWFARP